MRRSPQIASEYKINDLDDTGQPTQRPGRPADHFPAPFANELRGQGRQRRHRAARHVDARQGAHLQPRLPVVHRRPVFTQYQEQGPDYIAAILKGYKDPPPPGATVPQGGHYNEYFPGHNIAMPPPLVTDGQVKYDDGTPETLEQYSKDIAAFLDVGGRAAHGGAQAHRLPGDHLPARAVGPAVLHQEEGVVGACTRSRTKSLDARAPFGALRFSGAQRAGL